MVDLDSKVLSSHFSISSQMSSSCSSSEDDMSETESVIDRLSRGVARLFHKVSYLLGMSI